MKGLRIEGVASGSIAQAVGLEPGDRLGRINGRIVRDALDYRFLIAEETLTVLVKKSANGAGAQGESWEVHVEKEADDDLGVTLPQMRIRRCPNRCVFCFVDQMPPGLRKSLYIRDEDFRYSFLYGNYITLTNLTAADHARIVEQRLSPLYISVHATDPTLRRRMLRDPQGHRILDEMSRLAQRGIQMHAQVVVCPGWNDGPHLSRTIQDLQALFPAVASLAVVPVGLTRFRKGLEPLTPPDSAYARGMVESLGPVQTRLARELGMPFLFLGDAWYIMAGLPLPALKTYGDLPQLENGVGMVPQFLHTWRTLKPPGIRSLAKARDPKGFKRRAVAVTGTDFAPYLKRALRGVGLEVLPVVNRFFGETVTVAGLLTGQDIARALASHPAACVLIPDVALRPDRANSDREAEGCFLDGWTLKSLEARLGKTVKRVEATAQGLLETILGPMEEWGFGLRIADCGMRNEGQGLRTEDRNLKIP